MERDYSPQLRDLMQESDLRYETFKHHVNLVPNIFQESATNTLTVEDMTEIAEEAAEPETVRPVAETTVRVTSNAYEKLGIIDSDTRTYTGETVYTAPNYHGRGHTRSWDDIVNDLEESIEVAERKYAWTQRRDEVEIGLEEFM